MIRNRLLSKEVTGRSSVQIFDLSKIASSGLTPFAPATFYGGRILTRTYETSGATIGRPTGFEVGASGNLTQDYAVTYGYDNAGRLSTVTDPNDTFTYAYLANSNLRSSVSSVLSASSVVSSATYTYEPYRDVIASLENKVGTTTISKYAYTVNNLGQRTQRANTGTAFATASTDTFSYDAKGQVTGTLNSQLSTLNRSYSYDDIGNRKSATDNTGTTSYTANDLNQYSGILTPSSSLLAPSYDADGNLVATGGGQVYTWDGENRLVSVEPLVPTGGSKKQVNTYDAQGRRVRKTVYAYDGSAWNVDTDEKFVYDGWNVAEVLGWNPSTSAFELNKTYTWGSDLSGSLQGAGGVGGLLSAKDGGSVYSYTYDANGNVSEVVDSSGGIAAHYEYDAFGNTVASSGAYAATNVYRFSTKAVDDASGLYYYGLRYYDSTVGRWPSRDPINEKGGMNIFSMVRNNTISNIDFIGLNRWYIEEIHSAVVVEDPSGGYMRIEFRPKDGWWVPLALVVTKGQVDITRVSKPSGWNTFLICSTKREDQILLDWAYMMQANPPLYQFLVFNCRHFAFFAERTGIE